MADGKLPSDDAIEAAREEHYGSWVPVRLLPHEQRRVEQQRHAISEALRAAYAIDFTEPLVPVSEVVDLVRRLGDGLRLQGFENDWAKDAGEMVHAYLDRFGASTGGER